MATALDVEHPPSVIPLEDLFDMQLFDHNTVLPDSASSSASHHSPNSPDFLSYSPSTPPQLNPDSFIAHNDAQDPNLDPMLFYEILAKEFSESGSDTTAGNMGISNSAFPFSSTVDGISSAGSLTAFSPDEFTRNIDPSLMSIPVTRQPQAQAPQSELADSDIDTEDEQELEEDVIKPVKVGGKGKARKGTVASGGVVKRSAAKEKLKAADEDWRPSPEEYKKMSSKEKRQLRNKISARNFRVRRKEYINALEGDVAERDSLIEAIRDELSSTRLENIALRQEVEALKRAMVEGLNDLPPPAPLPSTAPASASAKRAPSTRSSLSKPNTQKDLPTSPRVNGTRGFWGGSSALTGGITSVHATLIPEFKLPSPPSSVPSPDSDSSSSSSTPPPSTPEACASDIEQENINPLLNLPCFGGVGSTPNPKFPLSPFQQNALGANFDAFAETNPFTLKSLDAYRMQLWGRMAREAGRRQQQQQLHQQTQQTQQPAAQNTSTNIGPYVFSPLTSALRPAYFTGQAPRDPAKMLGSGSYASQHHGSSLAALLAGKPFSSASGSSALPTSSLPTPPTSPTPSHASLSSFSSATAASASSSTQPTQTQAILAGLATQTLLSKLSGAFWDAFSARPTTTPSTGSALNGAPTLASSSSAGASAASFDHEKVRRVLEGTAVVKVVDVEHDLEKSMKALSIGEKEHHAQGQGQGHVGWRKYAGTVSGADRK